MNKQRSNRIIALIPKLRYLSSRGLPCLMQKLAEYYGVNEKTCRRDINLLCDEGIFIKHRVGKLLYLESTGKYFSLDKQLAKNNSPKIVQTETHDTFCTSDIESAEKTGSELESTFDISSFDEYQLNKVLKNKRIQAINGNNLDIKIYIYHCYIRPGKEIKNINGLYKHLKEDNYKLSYDIYHYYKKPIAFTEKYPELAFFESEPNKGPSSLDHVIESEVDKTSDSSCKIVRDDQKLSEKLSAIPPKNDQKLSAKTVTLEKNILHPSHEHSSINKQHTHARENNSINDVDDFLSSFEVDESKRNRVLEMISKRKQSKNDEKSSESDQNLMKTSQKLYTFGD